MSDDWSFPEGLSPFDEFVGPFPREPFIRTWMETLGTGRQLEVGGGRGYLPLVEDGGTVTIAGASHLTDYHSPLGASPEQTAAGLSELIDEGSRLILDSLPEASATAIADGLRERGHEPEVEEHEVAAVIIVDDDYLAGLSKKQRHEVRRKARRFEEGVGKPELVIEEKSEQALGRFVALHRQAEGPKGDFLTSEREQLFRNLYATPGWEVAELRAGGATLASLFGFRDEEAYYLYNSSYDLSHREVSPGVMALYLMIEHLNQLGCRRIDLLKGDEIYKFRMGAERRPLYRISL